MEDINVWTFLYGSYMDRNFLKNLDFHPEELQVGKLHGFDITIDPIANLHQADNSTVYGLLAKSSYSELTKLYSQVSNLKGNEYLPITVQIVLLNSTAVQALCYIAPSLSPSQVQLEYVNTILSVCAEYDFPEWYLQKIRRFIVT